MIEDFRNMKSTTFFSKKYVGNVLNQAHQSSKMAKSLVLQLLGRYLVKKIFLADSKKDRK
jgi:hypothetical protein